MGRRGRDTELGQRGKDGGVAWRSGSRRMGHPTFMCDPGGTPWEPVIPAPGQIIQPRVPTPGDKAP